MGEKEKDHIRQITFSDVNGQTVSVFSSYENETLEVLRQLVKDVLQDYKNIKEK